MVISLPHINQLKTKNKMLKLTNKQTGHSFNLSPKEAADFFCKKNARKEFINPFEKYLIKDTNNEVGKAQFIFCCIALIVLFVSSILLNTFTKLLLNYY
jgi:hypothetical protein